MQHKPLLDLVQNTYGLGAYGLGLVRLCIQPSIQSHNSDMYGPILFKLGIKIIHDGLHMHIILFCDLIKDGQLTAMLSCKYPMLNTSSTISWTCTY